MRVCISGNDSPPGKRKLLGLRCTVSHSGRRAACFRLMPVHSPMSRSARSRSMRSARFTARPMGWAVSRARVIGEQ